MVTLEALTRFSLAVPFEGIQDLHVQISAPKRALNMKWDIDQNNAHLQRSAKVGRGGAQRTSTHRVAVEPAPVHVTLTPSSPFPSSWPRTT